MMPAPPAVVRNQFERVRELFNRYVVPTYARFDLALDRGEGSYVWDVAGRRYLDLGSGIAVCSLGHAHPEITETLMEQSRRLVHVSNLYYHEPQGRLAERIVRHLAPGKVFFCNSGAEANEGLFKLARIFGHEEGRFEVLTTTHSFHGRTLAGIAATGQEKVKKGFGPMMPGFRHVPYNDLEAMRDAISPATAAILIEGIQGEGGITPATPDYLQGLRALCDERRLLFMIDGVQCGHFRSGRFQSYQRIMEETPHAAGVVPDALSMAKSLGGGFPIGAFWVREAYANRLGPGTHATTFGGSPLGCSVALKVFEVIERDHLPDQVRVQGDWFKTELLKLARTYPRVLKQVRGLGYLLGLVFAEKEDVPGFAADAAPASMQMVRRLHAAGMLAIPAGNQVVRFLPPLNLKRSEAEEGLRILETVLREASA